MSKLAFLNLLTTVQQLYLQSTSEFNQFSLCLCHSRYRQHKTMFYLEIQQKRTILTDKFLKRYVQYQPLLSRKCFLSHSPFPFSLYLIKCSFIFFGCCSSWIFLVINLLQFTAFYNSNLYNLFFKFMVFILIWHLNSNLFEKQMYVKGGIFFVLLIKIKFETDSWAYMLKKNIYYM